MTSAEPQGARRAGMGRGLTTALVVVGLIGVAAVLYVIVAALAKPGAGAGGLAGLNRGTMAKLEIQGDPTPAAGVLFMDGQGRPVRLTDFKGRAVVLNLWATWCPPCVKEMPTLAALQVAEAGQPVKVVAVSVDTSADTDKAKAFMATHAPLTFYQDAKFAFLTDFNPRPQGFPTTVLIDKAGQVRAVYSGEADWSSPDAKAVVARLATL